MPMQPGETWTAFKGGVRGPRLAATAADDATEPVFLPALLPLLCHAPRRASRKKFVGLFHWSR